MLRNLDIKMEISLLFCLIKSILVKFYELAINTLFKKRNDCFIKTIFFYFYRNVTRTSLLNKL